jgi:hypothetical protein
MFHKEILTTDHTMLSNENCNMKIHQHKRTCKKSQPMKHIKILLFLDEQDCMPNHGEINIQIY